MYDESDAELLILLLSPQFWMLGGLKTFKYSTDAYSLTYTTARQALGSTLELPMHEMNTMLKDHCPDLEILMLSFASLRVSHSS